MGQGPTLHQIGEGEYGEGDAEMEWRAERAGESLGSYGVPQ